MKCYCPTLKCKILHNKHEYESKGDGAEKKMRAGVNFYLLETTAQVRIDIEMKER